jgi:hypothetical protein
MKLHHKSLIAIFVFLLVVGSILAGGCDDNKSTNKGKASGSTEYMESLVEKSSKNTISLDMADDNQYSYLKRAYLEAGKTPENSPELFADLEKSREAALEGVAIEDEAANKGIIDGVAPRDFMVSSVFAYMGRVFVTLTSTVKYGSIASSIMFRVTDNEDKPLTTGPSGWVIGQQFTNGKCFSITTSFPLTNPKATFINILGFEMININNIVNQKMTNVRTFVGENDPGLMARIHVEHPRDLNKDKKIITGVNRGWLKRDDYKPLKQFQGKIKIPFKGAFRVPYKVTPGQINKKETYIKLLGPALGGTVAMKYLGNYGTTFADALKFTEAPNGSTLIEWDIPQVKSWFDGNIFENIKYNQSEKVNWYINIAFTSAEVYPDMFLPMTYAASNDYYAPNLLPSQYPYPPHIEFRDSCIAAGSMIKMADGSLVPIEKIKMGNIVKGNGADLTVVDISIGIEPKAMYKIVDEADHNLLITETHPVLTKNRGIIFPYELAVGDVIVTEKGTKSVVSIDKEMYNGTVYNLMLGTKDELARAPKNVNMFYANGILIADGDMQKEYEDKGHK